MKKGEKTPWYETWWGISIIILVAWLLFINFNGYSKNCEYKSYDQISSKLTIGMSKSQVVSLFGNADSVYLGNFGAGSPCRTVDVLRYSCNGVTTAISFCDGEYVSIEKELLNKD